MKLKLRLFLPLLLVMLGVFGASFSLPSYASGQCFSTPYTFTVGSDVYTVYSLSRSGDLDSQFLNGVAFTSGHNLVFKISCYFYVTRNGESYGRGISLNDHFYFPSFPVPPSFYDSLDDAFFALSVFSPAPPSVYDEALTLSNIKAFYLGATGLVVSPVYSAIASENVDHVDVNIYKEDLSSEPLFSYTYRPTGPFHMFTGSGGTVSFSDGLGKTIVTMVPYSVNGNYGATYYATITPFGLRNTYYVDVPNKTGGSGTLDFNSYTQTNVSYSPTGNINQSTQISNYYYRTYNIDQSTVEEFYNTYDYSVTDNSYYSDNDLTFNTNIEITFPTIDGSWLKSLLQGFDFNISIDLLNFWIPGVPSWIIDLLIAGIAIIVAAVIAKVVFEIL